MFSHAAMKRTCRSLSSHESTPIELLCKTTIEIGSSKRVVHVFESESQCPEM